MAFRPVGGKYPSLCSRGGSTCLLMSVKFEDGGPEGWFFWGGVAGFKEAGIASAPPAVASCFFMFLLDLFILTFIAMCSFIFHYFPLFSFLSSYILNRGGTNYAYGMALGQPA